MSKNQLVVVYACSTNKITHLANIAIISGKFPDIARKYREDGWVYVTHTSLKEAVIHYPDTVFIVSWHT